MKKMLSFIKRNNSIIRTILIGFLTISLFFNKEYMAAMIGVLSLELIVSNNSLEEIEDIFKGIK